MAFSVWNEILLSLVLGLVQGVTEFLPVSSTAHLRLISELLVHKDIGLSTSNIIQCGSLIAILQYFGSDLKALVGHVWEILRCKSRLLGFYQNCLAWARGKIANQDDVTTQRDVLVVQMVVATMPIVVFALWSRQLVELLRENIVNIAYFLLAGGVLIGLSEWMHTLRKSTSKPKDFSIVEVLLIGSFQCLAVFPGISRSGAVLAGGLFLGRDRASSVRFSFLLSIPALGLASIYDTIKTIKEVYDQQVTFLPTPETWSASTIHLSVLSTIIAFGSAYLVGLVCLTWLLKYLATNDSRIFILYRVLLASVILLVAGRW